MSKNDFASKLNVAPRTVFNYESGRTSIDLDFLEAAGKLGVDVEYVLFGAAKTRLTNADMARLRTAIDFAAEFCRDSRGRRLPLDEEFVETVLWAFERTAKSASGSANDALIEELKRKRGK